MFAATNILTYGNDLHSFREQSNQIYWENH